MSYEFDSLEEMDTGFSAVEVCPLAPFIAWVRSIPESEEITKADIEDDANVYLLPQIETEEELAAILADRYLKMFENELFDWSEDTDLWPEIRDYTTFKEWFGVKFHSMVLDLTN